MGYYSDVAIILTRKGVKQFKKRLNDSTNQDYACIETNKFLNNADRYFNDKKSGSEAWLWDAVKWYPNDPQYAPEVDFIENFLTELDEEEYQFIRIGEEFDDLEMKGLYWDNPFGLELVRKISVKAAEVA